MCAFYQFMSTMSPPFLLIFCLFLLSLTIQPVLLQAAERSSNTIQSADLDNTIINNAERAKAAVYERAKKLALSQHETWLALLHYQQATISRNVVSQADDNKFFLHQDGKHNADAELVANIEAFFSDPKSRHAQCLFPARWWWLKQQVALSDDYDVQCPQLEAFMRKISQDKLFLVFPTMYLNNPGSIFGHTFLRFDTTDESNLLSQTLNYAARVDETDNLVTYVRKGLFGGYTGFFRIRPYFETVQEYNNIENRDIWEYQLAFSKKEIEQLVRHVWEIKDIDFDYYFFKENCSYRLLALLDIVRPGMRLTGDGKFPAYAIPVDTVRALDDIGVIKSRTFRASLATRIDEFFLDENEGANIASAIALDKNVVDTKSILKRLDGLKSDVEKVKVLQQSHNILQFYGKDSLPRSQRILELANKLSKQMAPQARSIIKTSADHEFSDQQKINTDFDKASPEKGHESSRVSAGYGKQNNVKYIDLRFRPAFHDLMDSAQGYISGAAINSFETRLKWFTDANTNIDTDLNTGNSRAGTLRLESLSILNITSLNAVRHWYKPLSWLLDFRFDRTQLSKTNSVRNFISRAGIGLSFQKNTLNNAFTPFVMMTGEWNLSSHYEKGHSLLLGLQAGLQLNFRSNRFMWSFQNDKAISGFDLDRLISQLQWQYDFQVNHAMRLQYKQIKYDFFEDDDWSLSYNYYF